MEDAELFSEGFIEVPGSLLEGTEEDKEEEKK